ncbi:hypothetical protein JT358_04470 [Micrococcales bacterium 31B]|nr:hypothetical protein [Micrococcales bacterium 31B]
MSNAGYSAPPPVPPAGALPPTGRPRRSRRPLLITLATIAAVAVAVTGGYFGVRQLVPSGPDVPLAACPADTLPTEVAQLSATEASAITEQRGGVLVFSDATGARFPVDTAIRATGVKALGGASLTRLVTGYDADSRSLSTCTLGASTTVADASLSLTVGEATVTAARGAFASGAEVQALPTADLATPSDLLEGHYLDEPIASLTVFADATQRGTGEVTVSLPLPDGVEPPDGNRAVGGEPLPTDGGGPVDIPSESPSATDEPSATDAASETASVRPAAHLASPDLAPLVVPGVVALVKDAEGASTALPVEYDTETQTISVSAKSLESFTLWRLDTAGYAQVLADAFDERISPTHVNDVVLPECLTDDRTYTIGERKIRFEKKVDTGLPVCASLVNDRLRFAITNMKGTAFSLIVTAGEVEGNAPSSVDMPPDARATATVLQLFSSDGAHAVVLPNSSTGLTFAPDASPQVLGAKPNAFATVEAALLDTLVAQGRDAGGAEEISDPVYVARCLGSGIDPLALGGDPFAEGAPAHVATLDEAEVVNLLRVTAECYLISAAARDADGLTRALLLAVAVDGGPLVQTMGDTFAEVAKGDALSIGIETSVPETRVEGFPEALQGRWCATITPESGAQCFSLASLKSQYPGMFVEDDDACANSGCSYGSPAGSRTYLLCFDAGPVGCPTAAMMTVLVLPPGVAWNCVEEAKRSEFAFDGCDPDYTSLHDSTKTRIVIVPNHQQGQAYEDTPPLYREDEW